MNATAEDAPPPGTRLCALADVPDGEGREFRFGDFRMFVVRRGDRAFGYVNACAHFGVELNPGADYGFTRDGDIVCQHHGARYALEDGRCLKGECDGEGLTAVATEVREGIVFITQAK